MSNMILNRKAFKEAALAIAKRQGRGRFERVSMGFVLEANAYLINWIEDKVHRIPSKGITLK